MKKNYLIFVICLGMFLGLFAFKAHNDNVYLATNNESSLNQNVKDSKDPLVKHYYKSGSFITSDEYITEHTFFFQIEVVDTTEEAFDVNNVSVKNNDELLHVVPINSNRTTKTNVYTYEVVDLWRGTTYDDLKLTVYKDKVFIPLNAEVQTHKDAIPTNTTLYVSVTAVSIILLLLFVVFLTFYEAGMFRAKKKN